MASQLTAAGDKAPYLAQEAAGVGTAAGMGVEQSLVADKDSLESVSPLMRPARAERRYTVAVHAGEGGLPAAEALATAPLETGAAFEGGVTVPSECPLEVGRRYHVVIRPAEWVPAGARQSDRPEVDDHGNLKLGISLSDPYPAAR